MIHKGNGKDNFDVWRDGDELSIIVAYPPWTDADNKDGEHVRYVSINQMSVRASDGIRVYYDYKRDGFVVQQERWIGYPNHAEPVAPEGECNWVEVGFFQSWALETPANEGYDEMKGGG